LEQEDLCRLAALTCIILLLAALSSADTNAIAADFVSSLSSKSAADFNFLLNVLSLVLILRLRSVWPTVLRMFFIADFVFAIVENCGTHDDESGSPHVKRLINRVSFGFRKPDFVVLSDGYSFI
jgi:hypothetical protein